MILISNIGRCVKLILILRKQIVNYNFIIAYHKFYIIFSLAKIIKLSKYLSMFKGTDNVTRMHSKRMHTARSLTVSRHIPCTPPTTMHAPANHTWPPATMHAPHGHACPLQPHTPPPPQPRMSPATMHPPATRHAPRGQTDTCKNITFANFVCGR